MAAFSSVQPKYQLEYQLLCRLQQIVTLQRVKKVGARKSDWRTPHLSPAASKPYPFARILVQRNVINLSNFQENRLGVCNFGLLSVFDSA